MDTVTEVLLDPGSPVLYQGQPYQILQLLGNLKTVMLEDPISGRRLNAPIAHLSPPASKTGVLTKPAMSLESISSEDWAVAQNRMAIIKPLLVSKSDGQLVHSVAQQYNIGPATIYRWLNLFKTTGQLSSLIPGRRGAEQGQTRLSAEVETLVRASLDEVYLTKQRYSLKRVYLDVVKRCKRCKVPAPHPNTIRNRILAIRREKVLRRRHGDKAADDKHSPHKGKFPGADFPLAVVQIDHTPADVILVDDQTRMPLGKPWITMAIDVYSRIVVGFYVSFETPGALGVGMCLASAILPKELWLNQLDVTGEWPCWGKMTKIYADNAKEFRGNMLKRVCEDYSMDLEFRPVRTPRYGAHIERLMGTLAQEIHCLPGTTRSNTQDKGEYRSAKEAALTLGEFEKWLLHLIVNIYHRRGHSGLNNRAPMQVFEDGIYEKTGLPPRINDIDGSLKVKLDFLPYYERTIQEYGVLLDHIYYYSDVLRPWIHTLKEDSPKSNQKRKFIFKRDPRDISVLFFYDPDAKAYFPIPYRDSSYPPVTLWEHRRVLTRLADAGIKNIDQAKVFEEHQVLRDIEEQAKTQTRIVRRERQRAKARSSQSKSVKKELLAGATVVDELLPAVGAALQRTPVRPSLASGTVQPFEEVEHGKS